VVQLQAAQEQSMHVSCQNSADCIRELENRVRELSKTPQDDERPSRRVRVDTEQIAAHTPPELRSNDPMMLEEDGDVQYLES
jgi:hypothetical protein